MTLSSTTLTPEALQDASIPDIVAQWPATQAVFEKFGMHTNYEALTHETLLASARVNQVDGDALVAALQQAISA